MFSIDTGDARPILQSRASEKQAAFSPDSQWIAFTSDESGRDEVYVQRLDDSSQRKMVSTGGGSYPWWSRDGNELFYLSAGNQLVSQPIRINRNSVTLGQPRLLMRMIQPPPIVLHPYDVAADGRILALAPAAGAAPNVSLTVLVNWQTALRQERQ
jgi:hypothetical protein